MATKHDNRYDEDHGQGVLPSVVSKARLLLPNDVDLVESIKRVIEPEEQESLVGFWGRFIPAEPKKKGRPFTKKRGGNKDGNQTDTG